MGWKRTVIFTPQQRLSTGKEPRRPLDRRLYGMEANGHIYTSTASLNGEGAPAPIIQETVWAVESVRTLWSREQSLPSQTSLKEDFCGVRHKMEAGQFCISLSVLWQKLINYLTLTIAVSCRAV
jgi:hypothetical protein